MVSIYTYSKGTVGQTVGAQNYNMVMKITTCNRKYAIGNEGLNVHSNR